MAVTAERLRGDCGLSSDVREIKTRLDHVATKEDLEKVKALIEKKDAANSKWFLGITIGAIVTVMAALVRTFLG